MKNIYIYVKKSEYENCIKYGIKLSEFADIVIDIDSSLKKGITAYLSPKDSEKYYDSEYICLKVNTNNLKIYIINLKLQDTKLLKKYVYTSEYYKFGTFEEPVAIICTTILPENISMYNKVL